MSRNLLNIIASSAAALLGLASAANTQYCAFFPGDTAVNFAVTTDYTAQKQARSTSPHEIFS